MKDYLDNTNARIELLGVPNILNFGAQFISASRASMFNHHISQAMTLNNPEFNRLFTGEEHKFIPYEIDESNREYDCEILEIIPKYEPTILTGGAESCPEMCVIVLTLEPGNVRRLDYFSVKRYFMGKNGFGYIPILETRNPRRPGDILYKEDPITHSPTVKGNQWCPGTNLNIIYGSFPETIEDAFIVSESAAKKLQATQISELVLDVRQDRRPLNFNGDEYTNKLLPNIGEYVREDGILCGWRPAHWTTIVADSDPKALREPLPFQDDIIRIDPGSKIVDLDFNTSTFRLNDCYEQAGRYISSNSKYWEKIYDTYLKYKSQYKLTDKMWTLVKTAGYRMLAQGQRVDTIDDQVRRKLRSFELIGKGNRPVEFMQIVVTYATPRPVVIGSKLTDLSGSKGVVGKIYPDDWMPVDEQGIRAEMWIDMNSPVGRNNPSQLYETGINRISEFVRRAVKETLDKQGSDPAFEKLVEWCSDVNPNYGLKIRENFTDKLHKKNFVQEAIDNGIRLWIPPFLDKLTPSEDDFWNALSNIKKWKDKWGAVSSRIRYKTLQKDGEAREFISETDFAIGSKYILHLDKLPEITAPGPASVNHMGIPTKNTFENKHYPVNTSPYRFGEDEIRMMALDCPIREVTRFQALNANSPTGVRLTIRSLYLDEDPSNMDRIPITNAQLIQTNAVLNLFHNTTAVLGLETKNTKIDAFDIADELSQAIVESDDVDVDDEEDRKPTRRVPRRAANARKRDKLEEFMNSEPEENEDGFESDLEIAEEDD